MRVNHVNIVVSDMERSLVFYRDLLGMRVTFEIELEGAWIERVTGLPGARAWCVFCQPTGDGNFAGAGARFELLQYRAPEGALLPAHALPNTIGLRHVALEVDDLDEWHARLRAAGARFVSDPVTVPFDVGGPVRKRLCYLHDPDGTLIELSTYVRRDRERPDSAPEGD